MKRYQAVGYVLKRQNLGELDKIIIFFSQQQGKLKLIAKGVRKSGSRRAGHLEPFVLSQLDLYKAKTFDVVASAQTKQVHRVDSGDLKAVTVGYEMLELVDKLLPEAQPNPEAFGLLNDMLVQLNDQRPAGLVQHYFFVRFLKTIGSQPELSHRGEGKLAFDLENGKIINALSRPGFPTVLPQTVKLWRIIYSQPYSIYARIGGLATVLETAQPLIEAYYAHHFGLQLKSSTLLG